MFNKKKLEVISKALSKNIGSKVTVVYYYSENKILITDGDLQDIHDFENYDGFMTKINWTDKLCVYHLKHLFCFIPDNISIKDTYKIVKLLKTTKIKKAS